MLGPSPYKKPPPISTDTQPPSPTVEGVPVPSTLKVRSAELVSLAEAPDVEVPSTYDDALRNDQLLENPDLIDENNIEVFPSAATKDEIAFGVPAAETVDVNAFGGNIGKSTAPAATKVSTTTPLTTDEKSVVIQNSVIVTDIGVTGDTGVTYELGTKLVGVPESQQRLQTILTTTVNLAEPDTDIIEVQEFVVPDAPSIVDGGEF